MDRKRAIAALGALAQETRLELFRLLVTRGPEGLPAGVIAEKKASPTGSPARSYPLAEPFQPPAKCSWDGDACATGASVPLT